MNKNNNMNLVSFMLMPEMVDLLMTNHLEDEDILTLRAVCYPIKESIDLCNRYWKRKMDRDICFLKHFGGHVDPCTKGSKCKRYEHFYDVSSGIKISESPLYTHTFKGYMLRKMDCNWKTMFWHGRTMELYETLLECLRSEYIMVNGPDTQMERIIISLLRKKTFHTNAKRKIDYEDYQKIRPEFWAGHKNKRMKF